MKKSKRGKKVSKEQKIEKLTTLKEFSSSYEYKYNPKEIDLVVNAAWCAKITETNCWRPDIFLDNDRTCNLCQLYDNCACLLKNRKKIK